MLRTIPNSSITHADDGLIRASVLGVATSAEQLESYARKRARDLQDAAQEDVERLYRNGIHDGFIRGYVDGLAAAQPSLMALLADRVRLREAVLRDVRQALQAALMDVGLQQALIEQACHTLQASAATQDATIRLDLPLDRADLKDALAKVLVEPAMVVQLSDVSFPTLSCGDMVSELDPEAPLLLQADCSLDQQAIEDAAHVRAQAYGDAMIRQLANTAVHNALLTLQPQPRETD